MTYRFRNTVTAVSFLVSTCVAGADPFLRGDVTGDGAVDQADAAALSGYLFSGAPYAEPSDRADLNDNEWITVADFLFLESFLSCPSSPPIPPPSGTASEDPTGDQHGFDQVDPGYAVSGSVEVTRYTVEVSLRLSVPEGAVPRGCTIVLACARGLVPRSTLFCPEKGIRVLSARSQDNHVLLRLTGPACSTLPGANARAAPIELGTVHFAHGGAASCVDPPVVLVPAYVSEEQIVRQTIVDELFGDHHPVLTELTCIESVAYFLRGDANGDSRIDVADPVTVLSYLFAGGPARCLDAFDANDDGTVDIADAVTLLGYLFGGSGPLPEPFLASTCGPDPTLDDPCRELGCRSSACRSVDPDRRSPWPTFRHDLRHTGRTPFGGPASAVLAWKFKTGDGVVSSPSIGADGTIYVGSGWFFRGAEDHNLYALRPDGSLKWRFEAPDGFFSSPALGPENTIFISCLDGNLYALRDKGTEAELLWKVDMEFTFGLSSPAVAPDGTVYVGSPSFSFYVVDPAGAIIDSFRSNWCIISSPAIGPDGSVYIGSKDHHLYCFRPRSAELKWAFSTGNFYDGHLVDSSPAIARDGTVYFGTDQYGAAGIVAVPSRTNFWAVNSDGTLKWTFETEDGVESSPAIGADGTVYFGSYDGYVYAVRDDGTRGTLVWKHPTGGPVDGSPTVDGEGTIYIGSRDGLLYAFRPDGTVKWTFEAEDGFESSPTIDGNGRLYIGSFDGYVYALGREGPDIAVIDLQVPDQPQAQVPFAPRVSVRNLRAKRQQFPLTVTIGSEAVVLYEYTLSAVLSGAEARPVLFPPWRPPQSGTYRITARCECPEDVNAENDVIAAEFSL